MKKNWAPYADLLIRNARIYTVDLTVEEIQAGKYDFTVYQNGFVAEKDGKTIGVGEGAGQSFEGTGTKVIDAQGNTVIPGLVDSHMHAMFAGTELLGINFEGIGSLAQFQQMLHTRAEQTPKGEWIKGSGWNEMVWDETKMPTRYDLDEAAPDHPVYCFRLCHHVYVANSKALELAGITKDTPDPEGGRIGRDENGELDGLLYENSAMGLIDTVVPPLTEEQLVQAIESIGRVLNACGITTCIDANMGFDHMRAYLRAKKQGRLTYRENMMFYLDKAMGDMPYHLKRMQEMIAVTGFGDDMLKLNGIKVTLDGIPATGTAAMRQPYDHIPDTSGELIYTKEQMLDMGRLAGKLNWQIGIHCCGDRSADVAMDTFEAAYEAAGNHDARHYIIHMAVTQPDQVERLKKLNVPITVQPTINLQMGEQALIGERLASRYMLIKTPLLAGVIVGGSTDFPVVTCNPFEGMYGAISRESACGCKHLPEEALTAAQALILWTKNSAYFSHDDDKAGSIEVGHLADYVIIDTPLLDAEPEEIRKTRVLKTIVGGTVVYEA
ncbi:MAG: hypothetical protein H6Q60_1438 [Oscillospiraceae bacterium]|nr:hypothetical protein [Oscillospiraceae bacterium]